MTPYRLSEQGSTYRWSYQDSTCRLSEPDSTYRPSEADSTYRLSEQDYTYRPSEPALLIDPLKRTLLLDREQSALSRTLHINPNSQVSREELMSWLVHFCWVVMIKSSRTHSVVLFVVEFRKHFEMRSASAPLAVSVTYSAKLWKCR